MSNTRVNSRLRMLCVAHPLRCLALIACAVPSGWTARSQPLPDPEKMGPYPVGVTTIQLDDHARPDPETGGPRGLLTEIWYPAADEARNLPKNKYSEFVLRGAVPGFIDAAEEGLSGYKENFSIAEFDKVFENVAVRDARVREGRFPLLVFSHGSGGTRVGYIYFVEYLASHGYIVMAADHTGNSRFTFLDGKVVKRGGVRAERSRTDRPNDVSFLIDTMAKMNQGTDSRFAGRVNMEQVAAAGMSFGGSTTMRVLDQDARVKAGVMLAPGGGSNRTDFTSPIMMMLGTEDSTIGLRGNGRNRRYYEESKGPRYLVEIKDGGHFTFTGVEQYNPNYGNGIGQGTRITKEGEPVTYLSPEKSHHITNAYAIAFLGFHVRGQSAYKKFLSTNHYGSEIIYKSGQP